MIRFKAMTLKNFMSVGNVTQTINFVNHKFTLILGENLDLGGEGNRNGVGKTAIINALSFVLYGQPLFTIKKDNLINNENLKGMVVSLDYDIDGRFYRIERGRKPNFCRYYVNNQLLKSPISDETAGESKWTQEAIERDLSNLSHYLFQYIVSLHIKTTPFLSLREKDQKEFVEELWNITELSRKAESLSKQIKQVKDEIRDEEVRIKTSIASNDRIQLHINDLKFKSNLWEKTQATKVQQLREILAKLANVDINLEISIHKFSKIWLDYENQLASKDYQLTTKKSELNRFKREYDALVLQMNKLRDEICPTCGQTIHGDIDKFKSDIDKKMSNLDKERLESTEAISNISDQLTQLKNDAPSQDDIDLSKFNGELVTSSLEDALNHRHKAETLNIDLTREIALKNPYIDQIADLTTSAVQVISYEYLNELSLLRDHQEFLLKLLTSKESFIRKKIIDQNLAYLNQRLDVYLQQLSLPFSVAFRNDLSIDIVKLGKDYDYDQLSSGQSNRLILGISWAFRDMWENINHKMNLWMIDELIDQGLDERGTEASMTILKNMSQDKNIFLISHKDGLEEQMDDILLVQMENKFTSFSDTGS